ncbi:ead/Ea22-like family protein [Salmonella enterica subsp. enterica serovar Anatum]|nr:ead/Ea22-like family protein [Salmonella enterica subsp. enterica serovar Newport]
MSNIDKQELLVSKAKASVFTMGYISQFEASDIDSDDIDLRFEVDGVETGTTVSIVDECGHAAQIITALLDELEHYKSREERVTKLVMDNSTSWDALYKKLEAAERRIAEHCKVLNSLAAVARRYLPDYDEHPEIQAADELLESAAGIGVKQQEDIVDSDVGSRNQPGTVTAIYIGAGDFVKVKGQVFEVEETDFDDHDVTLWFVGGNALKCSAGCPVEVVSAPVAAGIKVKGE